jgi:hypothetical protein
VGHAVWLQVCWLIPKQLCCPHPTSPQCAGCSPIVAPESLLNLFAQFGRVMDLNLFRPYKGCRTSKVSTAGHMHLGCCKQTVVFV